MKTTSSSRRMIILSVLTLLAWSFLLNRWLFITSEFRVNTLMRMQPVPVTQMDRLWDDGDDKKSHELALAARRIKQRGSSASAADVAQLRPFYGDESKTIQLLALRTLEDVDVGAAKQEWAWLVKNQKFMPQSLWHLRRIETRGMNAPTRLNSLCAAVGLKRRDLPQLSRIVAQPYRWMGHAPPDQMGRFVVEQVVDLVFEMGQDGQNVNGLARGMILTTDQRAVVEAAGLPETEAIQHLLDQISDPPVEIGAGEICRRYLVKKGQAARDPLKSQLEKIRQSPDDYSAASIYRNLFSALIALVGHEEDGVIKLFEYSRLPYVRNIARETLGESQSADLAFWQKPSQQRKPTR